MLITESQLRKIVRQEIARKIRLSEAVDIATIVKQINDEKIKDPEALKAAIEKHGEEAKEVLKSGGEEVKNAYQQQGGKPEDAESIVKSIVTGVVSTEGSVDSVAAAVAKELGRDELKNPLIAAIKKKKGGKDAAELSVDAKNALADAFLELVFAKPDVVGKVAMQLKKVSEEV
jgi:predicted RND superfamily exporter protein